MNDSTNLQRITRDYFIFADSMGIFFKKKTRQGLDRKKVVASYTVLGICILLMAVNVGSFIFFPRLMAPLAILLSNAITLILAVIAFRPINALVENLLEKRQQELLEQQQKEVELEKKVGLLESRNRELENKLDTRAQTEGMPADIDFTFKLEQMEYAKKGYVVKEDELESLLSNAEYKDKIPDKGFMTSFLEALNIKEQGIRKILYIKKFYYKVSIGIDFTKIKFALEDGMLLFSGVKFTKLHDITSELEQDSEDIGHTWILNTAEDRTSIIQGQEYDQFKEAYSKMQEADVRESLEEEVSTLCTQYTRVFRDSIKERFANVDFVDGIEDSDKTWYALKEAGRNQRVIAVASNMLMLTDVIGKTQSLGQGGESTLVGVKD